MSSIKFKKFDKLFKFLPKSKIKAGEGINEGKYKLFTSSSIQSRYLDEFKYDSESLIFGTGGNASIHYCYENFATSTDCLVVEKKDDIDVKYVYYYLKSNMKILENGFKGAGLKHISKKYLSNIKVPILSPKEQRKISSHLSQLENLIQKREKNIKLLDELIKSTFLDMFTFNTEKDNWKLEKIEKLSLEQKGSMRTGPFGSDLLHSEFTENGDVAVLGIDNAVQNKFVWDKKRYISFKKYEKLKRYTIYPNDIIITIMGRVGRTAVVPYNIPLCINTKHLAAISLNQKIVNPQFLAYSLREDPKILIQIKRKIKGAIMDGLNLTIIKNINIKLPPKSLQDKFANIVNQIEKTKKNYQNSLNELNDLFGSVSQKAFKGELNLSKVEKQFENSSEESNKSLDYKKAEVLEIKTNLEPTQDVIDIKPKEKDYSLWEDVAKPILIGAGTVAAGYMAYKAVETFSNKKDSESEELPETLNKLIKEQESKLEHYEKAHNKFTIPIVSKTKTFEARGHKIDEDGFKSFLKELLKDELSFDGLHQLMLSKGWTIPYDKKFNKQEKQFTYKEIIFQLIKDGAIVQVIKKLDDQKIEILLKSRT